MNATHAGFAVALLGTLVSACVNATPPVKSAVARSPVASGARVVESPSAAPRPNAIPSNDAYAGLAVDGDGTTWFSETNESRLGRYRPGEPIEEIPLTPGAQPRTLRTAVDGSVWFAEPGIRSLGHIVRGNVTETPVNGGEFGPNWSIATGPDGSVWYDAGPDVAVRRRPDGTLTTYPIRVNGTITVDSRGSAWIPGPSVGVERISDSGQVSNFTFENGIEQVAEAPDGHLWFVDVRGAAMPRIGYLNDAGQPTFYEALNVSDAGFPNSVVRAGDGAVWFPTDDGRLVRLTSEKDVTVFDLPRSDIQVGPFAVLAGNRIVMVAGREVLDFVAKNGAAVAGAQAIPTPLPHVAKDAAEAAAYAAAYAAAQAQAGATQRVVLSRSIEGDRAAQFTYAVGRGPGYALFVYVVEDAGAWRKYDSLGTQNLPPPGPGVKEVLKFRSGCLNVHADPGLGSKVVECLPSGTAIEIDGLPAYADQIMWWHVAGHGWAAHNYLYCSEGAYATRADC